MKKNLIIMLALTISGIGIVSFYFYHNRSSLINVKKISYSEEKILDVASVSPESIHIGFNDQKTLVLYGKDFVATYLFDVEKEHWEFQNSLDLSPLNITLTDGESSDNAWFDSDRVLLSPVSKELSAKKDISEEKVTMYDYEFSTGLLKKWRNGADSRWSTPGTIFSASGVSERDRSDLYDLVRTALDLQSARLFGEIHSLSWNSTVWNTPITNMEFGFLALDAGGSLVYGMSDNKGTDVRLFDIFER